MANNPSTLPGYNGQTTAPDANYLYGSARNDAAPGDLTGTPRVAAEINDIFGFQQALLSNANIVPSGSPDTASNSQYVDAIYALIGKPFDSVAALDADTRIKEGDIVHTRGYIGGWAATASGRPKGGNTYEIVAAASGTDDGGAYIDLAGSGLQAKALFLDKIYSPLRWGAAADGATDDFIPLQASASFVEDINAADPKVHGTWDLETAYTYYTSNLVVLNNGNLEGRGSILFSNSTNSILQLTGSNLYHRDFIVRYGVSTNTPTREGLLLASTGALQYSKNNMTNVVVKNAYRGMVSKPTFGPVWGCTFSNVRWNDCWDWQAHLDCNTGSTTNTFIGCHARGFFGIGSTQMKGLFLGDISDVVLINFGIDQMSDGQGLVTVDCQHLRYDLITMESCKMVSDLSSMVSFTGGSVSGGDILSKVGSYDMGVGNTGYIVQFSGSTEFSDIGRVRNIQEASTTGTLKMVRGSSLAEIRACVDLDEVDTLGNYDKYYNKCDQAGYSNNFANLPTAGVARRIMWNRAPAVGATPFWIDDGTQWLEIGTNGTLVVAS